MNEPPATQMAFVEQSEVVVVDTFPKHIVLKLLRRDGVTFEVRLGPHYTHKLSDDLMRGLARIMPRPGGGG